MCADSEHVYTHTTVNANSLEEPETKNPLYLFSLISIPNNPSIALLFRRGRRDGCGLGRVNSHFSVVDGALSLSLATLSLFLILGVFVMFGGWQI